MSTTRSESVSFTPTAAKPVWVDTNNNAIADSLEQEFNEKVDAQGAAQEYVDVIVMLKDAPTVQDADAFIASSGYLTTSPWANALYGFGGTIKYGELASFIRQCPNVLLVEKDEVCNATIAYAAQQAGARVYAWNNLGLQGDPNAAIAVLDTGIDASHTDFSPGYGDVNFSKKIVGWNDQVGSTTSPIDDNGHGSHCSGLAAGNGFFAVDDSGNARATWSADFTPYGSGTYYAGGMMVNKTGSIVVSLKWSSTGTKAVSSVSIYYGGKNIDSGTWSQVSSVDTTNQNTFYSTTYNVASSTVGGYDMYHIMVTTTGTTGNFYIAYNVTWPYLPPSDGYSAWTGIAPQSRLVGIKVLNFAGSGTSTQMINGVNWLISNRATYHITVASMSLGFTVEVASVDTAILNLVNSGVTCVISAGNSGPGSNSIYTPGSVDEAITVASMNTFDAISSYSSQGGPSHAGGYTTKPDITAPGGSHFAVPLYSADSNTNDASGGFTDIQANDAAPMQGTSMACPVVAGATELVVQAMGGYSIWNWTRAQALYPKTILLMTATETYPNYREMYGSGYSPTLNRGVKDAHEGYGRLNVDTALDAIMRPYTTGTTVSDTLGIPPTTANISTLGQKLAWARHTQLAAGTNYTFILTVPVGSDYDLYLYNTTGNAYGEPVILTSSTTATTGGTESLTYTPSKSGQYFIVVKRASETTGGGQFTLTSTPSSTAQWTFMVYMDADNNLEEYGWEDFNEMEVATSNVAVNIVVQFDRISGYFDSIPDWTTTRRYLVTHDMDTTNIHSPLNQDLGELNMGDTATLMNFVIDTISIYPAQHYALVLWDHGSGWRGANAANQPITKGVCYDDTNGDYLSTQEVRNALSQIYTDTGVKLDILGYDACLMAMIEIDYETRQYTDYRVGSEETEPADGWTYDASLGALTANPAMTPSSLASQIVNDYFIPYGSSGDQTQSAVNLSSIGTVKTALDAFAQRLILDCGNPLIRSEVITCRNNTQAYYDEEFVDIYHFAYLITQNATFPTQTRSAASVLMTAVSSYVSSERHGSASPGSHGLSIYFPSLAQSYETSYATLQFAQDSQWDEFLQTYRNASTMLSNVHLVVRGLGNAINYRVYNGDSFVWGSWATFPGSTSDAPSVTKCGNELHVIVKGGTTTNIYHSYVNIVTGAFSGWFLLSGATASSPALSNNATHLILVVRTPMNVISYRFYNIVTHVWSSWSTLPGSTSTSPSVAILNNQAHIVVKGQTTTTIWHSYVSLGNGAFSGWSLVSGATLSTPALVS